VRAGRIERVEKGPFVMRRLALRHPREPRVLGAVLALAAAPGWHDLFAPLPARRGEVSTAISRC